MARTRAFEAYPERYDTWFARHEAAYRSELDAVRALLPAGGRGIEVGVGSGRFAAPLGVAVGVDPAKALLAHAARRGIRVARAVAESLPFREGAFDHVLIVTTICFVDDPAGMLAEARRVLRAGGAVCIGFVDRASALGRHYLEHRDQSPFYRDAVFYSSDEVEALLRGAGFIDPVWVQTLFGPVDALTGVDAVREGRDAGGFVVVRAVRD
jgi:SAM-dependent methyltransferase